MNEEYMIIFNRKGMDRDKFSVYGGSIMTAVLILGRVKGHDLNTQVETLDDGTVEAYRVIFRTTEERYSKIRKFIKNACNVESYCEFKEPERKKFLVWNGNILPF